VRDQDADGDPGQQCHAGQVHDGTTAAVPQPVVQFPATLKVDLAVQGDHDHVGIDIDVGSRR
jgi:hypothetical protein